MKIVSFEVERVKDLRLLLKVAKTLGLRQVNTSKVNHTLSQKVRKEIKRAEDDMDRDF